MALPAPVSLCTWIPSVMSIAGIVEAGLAGVSVTSIVALSAMILAGTYFVSYGISLYRTLINKRLKLVSFLPVAHIFLTVFLFYLWNLVESM